MGIFSGCLLASDVDGTLLTGGIIPEINLEKIDWFKSEGGVFTLCTGRSILASKYSYDLSHSNAPLIAFHGGGIYDYNTEEFLDIKLMPMECREILKSIIDEFPEIGIDIHGGNFLYDLRKNNVTEHHAEYESMVYDKIPDDYESMPWIKIFLGINDLDTLERVEKFCERFSDKYCRFMTTLRKPNAYYVEIVPSVVNKGNALRTLKEKLGAKVCFGIGDYVNDIELIRDADIGATTAEAPDEIKQLADYVTCPCKDGAVADFIDQIALYMKGSILWTK